MEPAEGLLDEATHRVVQRVLQEVFGLAEFRPSQREIISTLLSGQSVVGILPTGAGKSLCYQLPSQVLGGLTVVVSPLIALMRDQVTNLRQIGIRAQALHYHQTHREQELTLDDVRNRRLALLYVSPERLRHPRLSRALETATVSLLVVDEAHLISQWGHDFRPDYQAIREFRSRVGNPPVLAVTATATPRVQQDMIQALALEPGRFRTVEASVDRPNVFLSVERVADEAAKRAAVAGWVVGAAGAVLVYGDSRARVETWARWLGVKLREAVLAYHAGMSAARRRDVESRFLAGQARIVVATSAFGMGIDRSDIRLVVHVGIPESVDAYYQEVGRAGRDGEPSQAALVWQRDDLRRRQWRIDRDAPRPGQVAEVLERLQDALAPGVKRPWAWDPEDRDVAMILGLLEEMGYLIIGEKRVGNATIGRLQCPWPQSLQTLLWQRVSSQYAQRRTRFRLMREYLESSQACRRDSLLRYFGQDMGGLRPLDCCDRCRQTDQIAASADRPCWQDLLAALKDWRREAARAAGMPAYLILHDRVLEEISRRRPADAEALSACRGIGPAKLRQFGAAILGVVAEYAHASQPLGLAKQEEDGSERGQAFRCFSDHVALSRVLQQVRRSPSTVLSYLEEWMQQAPVDVVRPYALSVVAPERYRLIRAALMIEGGDRLKPLMDRLNGQVSYQDLRIARALWRREDKDGDAQATGGFGRRRDGAQAETQG